MKSSSPIVKILSVALLLAVVVYFAAQLNAYFADPMVTTPVYRMAKEDAISVNGYVVRAEETFSSPSGTLSHRRSEGARVGAGQVLATVYPDRAALDRAQALDDMEQRMEQLQFALTAFLDPDAALKLDGDIAREVIALRRATADGDYGAATPLAATLKSAVMKRDTRFESREQVEQAIAALQNDINAARANLSAAQDVTAPYSGTYSGVCDGYETVLTPDWVATATVASLDALRPTAERGNVGKLIRGDTWYYVAAVTDDEAALLEKRTAVTLRFAKGMEQDVTMTVARLGPDEGGRRLLVLQCDRLIAQTTLLRHQAAEVVLQGYEGLRIPANALRLGEDGTPGVYCVVGAVARFKAVEVVYQGEGYALVRPAEGATGTGVLRLGDQVIATAGELFDGKVIG